MTRENKVFFSSLVAGAVAFSAMFAVVACGAPMSQQPKPGPLPSVQPIESRSAKDTGIRLWIDPETSCEYLYVVGGYVLHTRIASDGMTHRGCSNVASPVWTSPKQ